MNPLNQRWHTSSEQGRPATRNCGLTKLYKSIHSTLLKSTVNNNWQQRKTEWVKVMFREWERMNFTTNVTLTQTSFDSSWNLIDAPWERMTTVDNTRPKEIESSSKAASSSSTAALTCEWGWNEGVLCKHMAGTADIWKCSVQVERESITNNDQLK